MTQDAEHRPSVLAIHCSRFALPSQFLIGGSSCSHSRSWAALSLLIASLFLAPPPARAAHWAVTYQTTGSDSGTDYFTQKPFFRPWGAVAPGGGYGNWVAGNSSGSVTPILTWTLDPGETVLPPAPDSATAVVNVYITAIMDGTQQGGRGGVSVCTTSATDGAYGDTFPTTNSGNVQTTGGNFSHLEQKSGGATQVPLTTIDCTSACSSNGPNSGGFTGVIITTTPLNLALAGTTPGNGKLNILVGQRCSSSWVIGQGARIYVTLSNYHWSISGTRFQTWSADTPAVDNNPYNPDASYEVDGPGPVTNPTASWYWNDRLTPVAETVSCTATATPPSGYGAPFPVTITQQVTVLRPTWTATGVGGYVAVRLVSGTTNYEMVATSTALQLASGLQGGMNFTATVASPDLSLFGDGDIQLAQLCTPGRSYTSANGDYTYSQNGQEGLDGEYPYGWNVGRPTYQTDDLPGSPLLDYTVANFTMKDTFTDFIMYYPPGSAQCVPLAQFLWSTDGFAALPHTGLWSSYVTQNGSDNAGSVNPSGNTATFLLSNVFPMWTQITGTGTFGITSPIGGEKFRRSSSSASKRGHRSSATQGNVSLWETVMNKQINKKTPNALLPKAEDAQGQKPVTTALLRRRSGPNPNQQAKNEKCHALNMAGFEALRTGQYSDAEAYAQQVLTLTHGYDPLAPELLASALDAQGRTAEALHAYEVLANQGGSFPRIMFPYARLLLRSGHWAQAVTAYNKALPDLGNGNVIRENSHFSPIVPQPKELAVALHIAQGLTYGVATWGGHMRQEEAMTEFNQALHLSPDSAVANYYYGYGWQQLDLKSRTRVANTQRAKAAFQKAARLGGADVKKAATEELQRFK